MHLNDLIPEEKNKPVEISETKQPPWKNPDP